VRYHALQSGDYIVTIDYCDVTSAYGITGLTYAVLDRMLRDDIIGRRSYPSYGSRGARGAMYHRNAASLA